MTLTKFTTENKMKLKNKPILLRKARTEFQQKVQKEILTVEETDHKKRQKFVEKLRSGTTTTTTTTTKRKQLYADEDGPILEKK